MQKILIVDGNENVRTELAGAVKELGFESVEARDGAEALNLLNNENGFCLVVSDMALSEVRGYYMIQLLRNSEKYQQLPLIMTSDAISADSLELLKSLPKETTRFLPKATLMTKLSYAIRDLMKK